MTDTPKSICSKEEQTAYMEVVNCSHEWEDDPVYRDDVFIGNRGRCKKCRCVVYPQDTLDALIEWEKTAE